MRYASFPLVVDDAPPVEELTQQHLRDGLPILIRREKKLYAATVVVEEKDESDLYGVREKNARPPANGATAARRTL